MTGSCRGAALFLGVLCLGFVPSAIAEVRLQPGDAQHSPTIQVTATSRGPWTPVGVPDPMVLNPGGDFRGDGYPGLAGRSDGVLVAWTGLTSDLTVVAGSQAWSTHHIVPAADAVGTPLVRGFAVGYGVVWQSIPTAPQLRVVGVNASGESGQPVVVGDGLLVGWAAPARDRSVAVFVSPGGDLQSRVIAFVGGQPFPIPIPDPLTRVVAIRSRLILVPTGGLTTSSAGLLTASNPQIFEGTRLDGSRFAVLTWWESTTELRYIELAADGPVFPVRSLRLRGSLANAQALVKQAINLVGGR